MDITELTSGSQYYHNEVEWPWENTKTVYLVPDSPEENPQKKQKVEANDGATGGKNIGQVIVDPTQYEIKQNLLRKLCNKQFFDKLENIQTKSTKKATNPKKRANPTQIKSSQPPESSAPKARTEVTSNEVEVLDPTHNQIAQIAQQSVDQDLRAREALAVEALRIIQDKDGQAKSGSIPTDDSSSIPAARDLMESILSKLSEIDFSNGYDKNAFIFADYPKIMPVWEGLIALNKEPTNTDYVACMKVAVGQILRKVASDNEASLLKANTKDSLRKAKKLNPLKNPHELKKYAFQELKSLLVFPVNELKNFNQEKAKLVNTICEGLNVIEKAVYTS